ncbi:mucin-binding protein, partial [Limosilactobacillus mucosae]|uniref:mucin-binding protein n=1 Tax=Limosilactobacillus mucosae TaxID=97478 RepID=UPI003992BFA2
MTSKIDQLANDSTSNYQQLAKTYQATIKANPGLSAELAAAFDAISNETATRPKYDFIAFNPDGVTLGQSADPAKLLNGTYNAEWKKAAAKTTIEFVDDDNNGAVVGTPTVLSGYDGDVDAVSMTLPANYELVSGQTIPTSVTLSGADDTVQIHLKHQIQTIADNDPMNHTSFQVTVHYKKDGATNTFMPDTVITTKYKRTTTKDLVTGKYTATPFVLESISQTGTKIDGLGTPAEGVVKDVPAGWQYFTYSIPYNVSVPGWSQTHSGSSFTDAIGIAAGTSTAMKTAELTVIYTANTQTTHIKYVDANGTIVKTDTISGKTDTTQTVNSTVPAGWKMTTPQTIPTSVTFDGDGVPDTTITIEHNHVAVTHDKPQTTGTQIPNGATTAKFKGVGQSDLNKTVTRTVTITNPDGIAKTTKQTFTSTRDAVVDMVDGSVVYGKWTKGQWDAVDVPVIKHYTASQTSVPAQTVDGSMSDTTVNVTYTVNTETVTVQWVDDTENGKVVYSTNVSLQPGKTTAVWIFGLDDTGHASTDAVALSGMYDLVGVSDSNVLKSWGQGYYYYYDVFNLAMPSVDDWIDGNTYTVHLTHKIGKTDGYSSPTKMALRKTNSERYPNLMYTDDAAWNKTHKDVTRTITIVKPDGSQSTTTQKLAFSRQAQYDMVTGEFKGYTDWKEGTQTFAAYTPSAIAGYTAETAPAATTTGDSDNSTVTLHYTANPQTAKIVYTDTDGNTIKTDTVNGVTDQTVDTNSTVPTGWKLANGQTIPATIKLGVNTPDTKVIVEHDHVTITPDNPQTDGTDIPNGTAQFKGVSENDLNQTRTRTITVNDPHAGVKTITQTAKISRNATVDMIDGSVVYGDWSTAQWSEYVVPTVEHYTASQTSVPEQTVDGSTADTTVNVTYTVNAETVTVQWVDDTENGKVVYSTDVSLQPGKIEDVWIFGLDDAGHSSTDAVALRDMYDLAGISDSDVLKPWPWSPDYYDVFNLTMPSVDNWIDGNTYTVHLTHKIVKTDGYPSPTKVALRTTNSERYPNLMYTDDAALSKTQKDVTRTITVVKPDGSQSTTTQKLAFSRQAQYDMVTGEFKGYTDWKEGTQTFAVYTPDAIDGYTAETAPSATATGDSGNSAITLHYTANPQTAKIVYIDTDGNTVKTDTVNGVTDQTVDTNSTVPTGWKLVDGQTIPATIKLGVNTPDTKITVEHDHVTITSDNPQTDGTDIPNGVAKFKGVSDNDLNQTITRTIQVNDPYSGGNDITQTAKISRSATVDMVDGSVVYGDWSTAQWPEYVVPTIDGYTPTQVTVEKKSVTNGDQDETVAVEYLADSQTVQINYVYNGQVVKNDSLDGYTDDVVAFTPSVPTGYKLVDPTSVPSSITITANPGDVTIAVDHDHVTIASDKPQADGTQIPNGTAKFKGVSDSDLNKTVTRTVTITSPDGTAKTTKQTFTSTRDAVVDMVDGSVAYGDWTKGQWDAVDVPAIEHYTASQTSIPEQTVDGSTADATVNVTYTVNDETVTVQWIDDETGETLYSEAVTAKPNVTKTVYAYGVDSNGKTSDDMLYLQGCYELVSVSDTSVLTLYDSTMSRYFDAYKVVFPSVDNWIDGNTYSVHLKHHVVTVRGMDNPTSEAFRNTNTARYPKLMFTEDAATDKTNHTVTRTIILHQPSGDKTVIQSTDFERGAYYDAVNGKFLGYTDWHGWPTTLSSYEVPTVAGYTASIQEVPSLEINGDSADQAVEVNYTANAQTTHVVYVDQNGNQIQSDDVDGHTDETVKVTSKVPVGWVLADGQSVPESITFGVSTPDVKVVVKHGHVTVTPDAPKTSNDKLPDNPAQNYPTGVGYDNLNKTVTRTINVHNLDGTVTPIVQTAHLTRTADVDEIDGTVTYGEWTTGSWDKFVSTPIDGYTASLTEMPATEVSSATADTSFDVIYTANSQSMRINYIDENGQTVGSTIVNGHTDETVTTNSKVPVGWKLIDGQNVPTEITFKGAKTDDVTVKVEHAHVTVQPSDPKTFADKLPDNADKNYPSGVGYDDLNKTITRTIEIDEPNGNIIFVPKQEVHYTRTADVDEVNGTVTYGEWTTKDQFAEFANVPVFAGYTPSQDKVDATVPSVDDNNSAVKITYTANEQSMQIVYVDENGQTVKADTVKGHTDETVPTNSTVPAGWTTENTVPAEITFKGAKTADVTIKVKHAHVTVIPDKPKTANDKLPDNTDKNYPSGVDYNDLNKTVKRTINVYNVDGTATTVKQEVHFTRTADVDEVDGTVEYGSWQADKQFDQYAVPVVPGYVSVIDGKEQSTIQPAMPNVDDNDSTIDVTYQAVDGSQTIDYVDENDTVIGYQIITGKTAETKPVKSAVPTGWKLVDGQTVPATVTIKADDVPVKVLVEHDHVAVSHDNAQKDGTRIPNGVSVFNGVTDDDLNQTLTRTITVNDPHAGAKAITQTAKIYRD